jgi:hypothetical protein
MGESPTAARLIQCKNKSMTSTETTTNALENLNQQWREKGHPYAASDEGNWTTTCSSCSIATEEAQVTLVEAMSQAIRHRKTCKELSR